MIRTFLAIDLPEQIKKDLEPVMVSWNSLTHEVKWIKSSHLHLTLKFLGDVPEESLALIKNVSCSVAERFPEMTFFLSDTGVFPSLKRPRVLWIGLGGDLLAVFSLQKQVDEALEGLGYPREERDFTPHITVGRFRGPRKSSPRNVGAGYAFPKGGSESLLTRFLKHKFEERPFAVKKMVIYKSELTPHGPIYTPMETCPFKMTALQVTVDI
jgi:2'-5' RNA ligase